MSSIAPLAPQPAFVATSAAASCISVRASHACWGRCDWGRCYWGLVDGLLIPLFTILSRSCRTSSPDVQAVGQSCCAFAFASRTYLWALGVWSTLGLRGGLLFVYSQKGVEARNLCYKRRGLDVIDKWTLSCQSSCGLAAAGRHLSLILPDWTDDGCC